MHLQSGTIFAPKLYYFKKMSIYFVKHILLIAAAALAASGFASLKYKTTQVAGFVVAIRISYFLIPKSLLALSVFFMPKRQHFIHQFKTIDL
jgi:hypothetical protein